MFYSLIFFHFLILAFNISAQIDGGWSDYGLCTTPCGGTGLQLRTCTNPQPSAGGQDCTGSPFQECNPDPCPVDGQWTDWSPCSSPCGGGEHQRRCSPIPSGGGLPCLGDLVQLCNTFDCDSPIQNGGWTPFSPCSAYCGNGVANRTCTNPPPQNGGFACSGPSSMPCNLGDCPNPVQIQVLLETLFPIQYDSVMSAVPGSPSNDLNIIVQTDFSDVFSQDNWIQTEVVKIEKPSVATSKSSLKVTIQVSATGQWNSSEAPPSPLQLGQNFSALVVAQDLFIYSDYRRITRYINSSFSPIVTEIVPPWKFTFQWWMWIVAGGVAVGLCLFVSLLKFYFCKKWCEPDFELELEAVEKKRLAEVQDIREDEAREDTPKTDPGIPDTPPSLGQSLQKRQSSETPPITTPPFPPPSRSIIIPPPSVSSNVRHVHYASPEESPGLSGRSGPDSKRNSPRSESRTLGTPAIPSRNIPTPTPSDVSTTPSEGKRPRALLTKLTVNGTRKIRTSSFESQDQIPIGQVESARGSANDANSPSVTDTTRHLNFTFNPRMKIHFSPSLPRIQDKKTPSPPIYDLSPVSPAPIAEWEAHWDPNHTAYYYYNVRTGASAWQLPKGGRLINLTDARNF